MPGQIKKKIAQIPSKASRLECLPTRIKIKTSSSGIFREYLKEIMGGKDILTEALKQLLDIRTLLKEVVPRESGISLEPIQKNTLFALPMQKKRDLHVARHGEVAQVFRKF